MAPQPAHIKRDESFRDAISTVDKEGKRVWVYPKKPSGKFTRWRQWVGYALLTLLFVGPFLRIGGEPVLMINILERRFVFFGQTFWPQDFLIFVMGFIAFIVFVALFTVAFGRLFCGWACPQTVFMEQVFRRIEYAIEGDWKQQQALNKGPLTNDKLIKKTTKHVLFFAISFLIGNTFLAYIIGSDELLRIIREPASQHAGGLIAALWANQRRPALAGMVLNSPWLDMQGGRLVRGLGTSVIKRVGARTPARVIPRTIEGHYGRSLHADHHGEWVFNTDWKPLDSFPVTFGWLRAIRLGHDELHTGLEVGCPVLVLSSAGTRWPQQMGDEAHGYDIVLEVPQIRQWATAIGSHVTYVAIEGARHDVVLSRAEPRAVAYAEIDRWHATYVG